MNRRRNRMNIWIWFIITLLGVLGLPVVGAGVSLQLQANDGRLRSLTRYGQLIKRIFKSFTSRAYLISLALSIAWILTIYICYIIFTPEPRLPPAGDRAKYNINFAHCMVDPVLQDKVALKLLELGFSKSRMRSNSKDHRVSGTAMNDTVYFYHSTTEEFARAIAAKLNNTFDRNYTVIRGDGEGFKQDQFRTTFSIHTISKPCVATS